MKLFFLYLREHKLSIAAFLLFSAIYAAVFALYRLPIGAIVYPLLLSFFSGAAFLAYGFVKTKNKHSRLILLPGMQSKEMPPLPQTESIAEEDYQNIIASLAKEVSDAEAAADIRLNEATEYFTMWAHQIKTPISSMHLALQMEDSRLSRTLSAELFRIEQYVGMVMAFLRLDSPSGDYIFKKHSVDGIIRQSVRKFAPDFIARKLRFVYDGTDASVVTDDKWLSFVIEQLISNSLKYTREGEIKIYMPDSKTIRIDDTGIGIAKDDLPRIFDKGYTGKSGRTDSSASGLGLYLCKRIAFNLGIGIRAESEVGAGTSMILSFSQNDSPKE